MFKVKLRTGKRICLDHILFFYGCDKTPCQEQFTGFVWALCLKFQRDLGHLGGETWRQEQETAHRAPTLRKQGVNRKWNGSVKGLGPPTVLHFLQQGSASFNNLPQQRHLLEAMCSYLWAWGAGTFPIQTNLTHSYCTTNGDILKDIPMRITWNDAQLNPDHSVWRPLSACQRL